MTDKEAISVLQYWHEKWRGLTKTEKLALSRVIVLATQAADNQPAPGSVEVRVAVGVVSDTDSKLNAVLRNVREDGSDNSAMAYVLIPQVTHAAIVTAWIPPVRTPEVRAACPN